MNHTTVLEAEMEPDPIEEIRLRIWARQNYAPAETRPNDWHPVVLDEMRRKDQEQQS